MAVCVKLGWVAAPRSRNSHVHLAQALQLLGLGVPVAAAVGLQEGGHLSQQGGNEGREDQREWNMPALIGHPPIHIQPTQPQTPPHPAHQLAETVGVGLHQAGGHLGVLDEGGVGLRAARQR